MGNPGGLSETSDDAELRRTSELAAIDTLFGLWPDLKDQLVGKYLRGEITEDHRGRLIEREPDRSEPGPADVPEPDSLASASG
jgi:hypothetical protein